MTQLADRGINDHDRLVKLRPLIDQTCFEFIDVSNFGVVDFLLQNTWTEVAARHAPVIPGRVFTFLCFSKTAPQLIEHATPSLSWSKRRPTSYLRHCGRRIRQIWTRRLQHLGCSAGESLPLKNCWCRWTQNTSDRWVGAVWPVDRWCRYQRVASLSKRLCPCMRATLRAQILTILKRTVNCIILLNKP